MKRWITKQQLLDLVKNKSFRTEDEFRDYITPELIKLFKISEDQIVTEKETTSFDGLRSERADIIINSKDDFFNKALIVIELKLSRNIEKYCDGNLIGAQKQLSKYCQDTRSPYGILLSEDYCFIYRNKFFNYDQIPKRTMDKLPTIKKIEKKIVLELLTTFFLSRKSLPIIILILIITSFLSAFFNVISKTYGFITLSIISLTIGIIGLLVFLLLYFVFKIFD